MHVTGQNSVVNSLLVENDALEANAIENHPQGRDIYQNVRKIRYSLNQLSKVHSVLPVMDCTQHLNGLVKLENRLCIIGGLTFNVNGEGGRLPTLLLDIWAVGWSVLDRRNRRGHLHALLLKNLRVIATQYYPEPRHDGYWKKC